MIGVLILSIVPGIILLFLLAVGLVNLVTGIRDRKPGDAFRGVFVMLVTVGLGWAISFVILGSPERDTTEVDRAHAIKCTAKILGERDARSRVNGDEIYRFHVRVQIPGRAPYETDSTATVSALVAGGIGAGRTGYACRADRDHPKKVQILWGHPMP